MNLLNMDTIQELLNSFKKFRDERDWQQFHNPKDLALAISIEASELLELFLWKDHQNVNSSKVEEEVADILGYLLLFADYYNLNLREIVLKKIELNSLKYPIDKSKGNSKKYTEL